MSHAQPCSLGFLGTSCPECHLNGANRRDRLELLHRIIDADDATLLLVAHWLLDHDRDALREALDEAKADR